MRKPTLINLCCLVRILYSIVLKDERNLCKDRYYVADTDIYGEEGYE